MLVGGRSSSMLLVVSQLAQMRTPPAAELDNMIQFRLWSGSLQGLSGTCGTVPNSPAVSVIISFKTCQGLECQHVALTPTEIIELLCSPFILEPISHSNLILLGKQPTYFSQKLEIGNSKPGWSQVTFLNMETSTSQFLDKGGRWHFAVVSQVNVGNSYCRREASSIIFDLHWQWKDIL